MIYLYWVLGIIGYFGIGTFVAYFWVSNKFPNRDQNSVDLGVISMFWPLVVFVLVFALVIISPLWVAGKLVEYAIVCRRR